MHTALLLTIAYTSLLVTSGLAQRCASSNDTAITIALTKFPLCHHYVSDEALTYIPPFGFPDFVVTGMYQVTRVIGHRYDAKVYAPRNCSDQLARYFCTFLFRPCTPEGAPRPACRSICEDIDASCRSGVSTVLRRLNYSAFEPLLLPPCNKTETGNILEGSLAQVIGQPVFPIAVQYWNISGVNVTVDCQAPALVTPLPDFFCYGTAFYATSEPSLPYCLKECPLPHVRKELQHIFWRMMLAFGILGTISSAVALIARAAVPQYRQYPSNLVLCILAALLIESFNFVWPFWRRTGLRDFLCDETGSQSKGTDIRIQGVLIVYCDVIKAFYWGAIALHTLIAVNFGSEHFSRITMIVTHCYCLGVPIVLAIIALSTNVLRGGNGFLPFGYFKGISPEKPYANWPEFPLYWGPLAINILIAVVCLSIVLTQTIRRQTKGHTFKLARNFRIIMFLMVLLFIEVWKWSYRIYLLTKQKAMARSLFYYAKCSLFGPGCDRGIEQKNISAVFVAFIFAPPVLVGVLFVANRDLYRHWSNAFRTRMNPFTSTTQSGPESSQQAMQSSIMES